MSKEKTTVSRKTNPFILSSCLEIGQLEISATMRINFCISENKMN